MFRINHINSETVTAFYSQQSILQNAKSDLNNLLARNPDEDFDVSDSISVENKLLKEQLDISANNAISIAKTNYAP